MSPTVPAPNRYLCQRCGNCCRWPGDVRVTDDEVEKIAGFLGMETAAFIERHTRLNANRTGLSLLERPNGECGFLGGVNTCLIQPVKPAQCAGFPNAWNFPGWRNLCEAIDTWHGESGMANNQHFSSP
jgi:Fe-S-cluster containining protein